MKYLPSILAALSALAAIFAPQVQGLVAAHPTLSIVLTSVLAIVSHFLPSPVAPAAK
jgi:hypothetical protein